ncbi:MAG: GTPase Era [Angelakisella sp.]
MNNEVVVPQQKSAFIALVGKPNVGKSSLLNRLIGEKVAIVTNKPQTTRTRITGVLTQGETQLVFMDTPGMHKPKTALSKQMVKDISDSVADVDLAVLVVEPTGALTKAELELIEQFKREQLPAVAVMNKIDLLNAKDEMMPKMAALAAAYDFQEIVPVSALTGDGVEEHLLTLFLKSAQPGPHYFPDDTLTDQPERVICAEIIREKVLTNMFEEVPHGVAVTIEEMKERPDQQLIDMQATIYCERKSHKGMLIGKDGSMLKLIGTQARIDIERFLDSRVNLQCWVKVREDWRNEERMIKTLFGK